jgi:NADH:ubiquinone oxidoreductase subunit
MNLGIWIYTVLNGNFVGKDLFGNRYYSGSGKKLNKRERRWVVYRGRPEASKVPSEWHAWLHHTVKDPLIMAAVNRRYWQKHHVPNLTGTTRAYRPDGHEIVGGKRVRATGDYEAWSPE